MVNLLAHLDVDYPAVADYYGQSTEPVFLQAREGVEQEHRFSVTNALRQAPHRANPVQRLRPRPLIQGCISVASQPPPRAL